MSDQTPKTSNQDIKVETVKKSDKLTRDFFILPAFGGAAFQGYFSQFLSMLLTDIYMLPIVLAGSLETIRGILNWFAAPAFGTILDRVTLKKGKYWPWLVLGPIGTAIFYMILFTLPSMTKAPEKLGIFVFLVCVMIALFQPITATTINGLYPRLAKDPKTRSYLAIGQKLGRDGGKTIWGYIVPSLLVFFTAKSGSEAGGWASTSWIIGSFGVLCYLAFTLILKRSSVEHEALSEKSAGGKRKAKVPFSVVLKGLLTNRALLVMFLFMTIHKTYYFFQLLTASYFFKYVVKEFSSVGTFTMSFNLCAIAGAIFGVVWVKIFKDSKRAFVATGIVHIAILLIATLTFKSMTTVVFIVVISIASFFAGVIEAYLLPMFAAAADFGTWKTGARADGLNMALYSLSVTAGSTVSVMIRTALLSKAGYNAAAYAKGAVPTAEVINTLVNLQTLWPFILAIVCFALVAFFYPLNDKKLAKIREAIDAGQIGEHADKSILN